MSAQDKQSALIVVCEAAGIHSQSLDQSLTDNRSFTESFKDARRRYIRTLNAAIRTVEGTRFEDAETVSERVRDLDLAQLVALQLAVEDRIRDITPLSEFR